MLLQKARFIYETCKEIYLLEREPNLFINL